MRDHGHASSLLLSRAVFNTLSSAEHSDGNPIHAEHQPPRGSGLTPSSLGLALDGSASTGSPVQPSTREQVTDSVLKVVAGRPTQSKRSFTVSVGNEGSGVSIELTLLIPTSQPTSEEERTSARR